MAERRNNNPKSKKHAARKAIRRSLSSNKTKTRTNRTSPRRESRRRSLTKLSSSINNLSLNNVPSLEDMTSANYKNAVVHEQQKKVTERSKIGDALMFFLTRGGESPPSHGRYFNTSEATRILMLPEYRDKTRSIMSRGKEIPPVPIYEIGLELYRHFAESQAKEHEKKMTPDISKSGKTCLSKCVRTFGNRKCHCTTEPYRSWGRTYDWDLCDESKCPDKQTGFGKRKHTQKKRTTQKKRKTRSTRKR